MKNMRSAGYLLLTLLTIPLFMVANGCYWAQPPAQKQWHSNLWGCHLEVGEVLDKGHIIQSQWLEERLGTPDYQLEVQELERILLKQKSQHCSRTMDIIWTEYRSLKQQEPKDVKSGSAAQRSKCRDFDECLLWLYDESVHFEKPLVWGWNSNLGFSCYAFLLEDSQVVGSTAVEFWDPLTFGVPRTGNGID